MMKKAGAWRKVLSWLPALAIYAVICWFSAQPSEISNTQSAAVTDWIGFPEWATTLVRKLAHVSLFSFLGAATGFAWYRCDRDEPKRSGRIVLRAAALCAALAALDEFHQYFVPGRAALIGDVLLDTASAALGALCVAKIAQKCGAQSKKRAKNR